MYPRKRDHLDSNLKLLPEIVVHGHQGTYAAEVPAAADDREHAEKQMSPNSSEDHSSQAVLWVFTSRSALEKFVFWAMQALLPVSEGRPSGYSAASLAQGRRAPRAQCPVSLKNSGILLYNLGWHCPNAGEDDILPGVEIDTPPSKNRSVLLAGGGPGEPQDAFWGLLSMARPFFVLDLADHAKGKMASALAVTFLLRGELLQYILCTNTNVNASALVFKNKPYSKAKALLFVDSFKVTHRICMHLGTRTYEQNTVLCFLGKYLQAHSIPLFNGYLILSFGAYSHKLGYSKKGL